MMIRKALLTLTISSLLAGAAQADSQVIRLGRDVMPAAPQPAVQRYARPAHVQQAPVVSSRTSASVPRQSANYAYRPAPKREPGVIEETARSITRSAINTAKYEIRREVVGAIRQGFRRLDF